MISAPRLYGQPVAEHEDQALAAVDRHVADERAGGAGLIGGAVIGAVDNDDHLDRLAADLARDAAHDRGDRGLLVVGRDHDGDRGALAGGLAAKNSRTASRSSTGRARISCSSVVAPSAAAVTGIHPAEHDACGPSSLLFRLGRGCADLCRAPDGFSPRLQLQKLSLCAPGASPQGRQRVCCRFAQTADGSGLGPLLHTDS